MPLTRSVISSGESSSAFRLRRMSSAISIGQPRDEREQETGQVGGAPFGGLERLLVAERLVTQPLGEIGDHRDGGDAKATVTRQDRLLDGRHPDGVGAERVVG